MRVSDTLEPLANNSDVGLPPLRTVVQIARTPPGYDPPTTTRTLLIGNARGTLPASGEQFPAMKTILRSDTHLAAARCWRSTRPPAHGPRIHCCGPRLYFPASCLAPAGHSPTSRFPSSLSSNGPFPIRQSRVNWSTTVRMWKDCPSANLSLTKSMLQHWFNRTATAFVMVRCRLANYPSQRYLIMTLSFC